MSKTSSRVTAVVAERLRGIFEKICETMAELTGAPIVAILQPAASGRIKIIGAYGTSICELGPQFALPRLGLATTPNLFVEDMRNDSDFRNHPLLQAFPFANSIYASILDSRGDVAWMTLMLLNPSPALLTNPFALGSLHRLGSIVRGVGALSNDIFYETKGRGSPLKSGGVPAAYDAPTPAVLLGAEGRIVRATPEFASTVGMPLPSLAGKDIENLFDFRKSEPQPQAEGDVRVRTKFGQFANFSFMPIETPEGQFSAAVLTPPAFATPTQIPLLREGDEAGNETNTFSYEPTGNFLLKTLTTQSVLHKRGSCRYLTVRSWRSAIKDYQIVALKALKVAPPSTFIEFGAQEIAAAARETFGVAHLKAIVPIPGGNSGLTKSLSVLLAERVGAILGVPINELLIGEAMRLSASTPRKSAGLKPYGLRAQPPEAVLLVDDVASSGRHLELGADALRKGGASVNCVAWIGGKRR